MIQIIVHRVNVSGVVSVLENSREYEVLTGGFEITFVIGYKVFPLTGTWEKRVSKENGKALLSLLTLDDSEFSEDIIPKEVKEYLRGKIEGITSYEKVVPLMLRKIPKISY